MKRAAVPAPACLRAKTSEPIKMPLPEQKSARAAVVSGEGVLVSPSASHRGPPESRVFLPLLMLLFAGSGCAALIYEIVWFQMLQLVIGSTAVSIGVLLATFMGGRCLGSLWLPRWVDRGRGPLWTWAILEAGIGGVGLLLLPALPALAGVYALSTQVGLTGILFRGALCGACLLAPTVLMGATLPIISRALEASPGRMAEVGLIYCANTLGAVMGTLFAGFYLLRVFDTHTATYVAATLNGMLALGGLMLNRLSTPCEVSKPVESSPEPAGALNGPVYLT
ncbi:MAG TPA: hypothetical protein VHI52_16130, partial [Verrucomicrobiae bacterium]|nr:hypothetical protein [Verrucomicrobiae bacterium]